jgi:hypothetical protein
MRRLAIPLTAALLFVGFARAGDAQKEALAILDKAIKAQGGAEMLTKYPAGTFKTKGKLEILDGLDITQEVVYQMPGKFREEMSFQANGMPFKSIVVFNGTKGALQVNGQEMKLDKLDDALREASYMFDAFRLVPLRDKAYELTAVGETQVNGKPAIGIRASHKGRPDLTIYFDKETYLPVKVQHRTLDIQSGMEIDQERIITEYQKVDGVPVPKRLVVNRDGKKFLEGEVLEYKQHEKVDEGLFKLP